MKNYLKVNLGKNAAVSLLTLIMLSTSFAAQVTPIDSLPQSLGLTAEGLRFTVAATFLNSIDYSGFGIKDAVVNAPRASTDTFTRKFYLHYKTASVVNSNNNHLIFFIPGFGGKNDAGVANFFIELLTRQGFTVVSFDSPPSERFLLESSRLGIPGIQSFDAQDLYEGMQVAKQFMQINRPKSQPAYSKFSLIGTSLGGLNTAQVELISLQKESKLKFDHAISINPPISNVYGLNLIDNIVSNYLNRLTSSGEPIGLVPTFIRALHNKLIGKIKFDDLESRVTTLVNPLNPLSREQVQLLIGLSFSSVVTNAVKAFKVRHPEFPVNGNFTAFYDIFNKISIPMLETVKKMRLKDYAMPNDKVPDVLKVNINKDFLESIRKSPETLDMTRYDDIRVEMSSIRGSVDILSKAKNYIVLTFEDDFLLRINLSSDKAFADDDKSWLNANFNGVYDTKTKMPTSARSVLFKEGGHLGGYHQKYFQNKLLGFLSE